MKILYSFLLLLACSFASTDSKAQVPALNSYPAATATIFLDFDGHAVTNTSWNWAGTIDCAPSGMGNTQIVEIFNRVSEDYRPFNINITTDSTKYWSAPINQRMRVIITTSSSWYGSAGGVAYINSFSWGDNTPAFVFSALLNYNTKNVAEAASHEAGHTLGLRHQSSYDTICNKTAEYNAGTGTGEIGWAPIMGVGYYRNLTLWNIGANPYGCTSIQDDLSIITSTDNGFGYRPDDHANSSNGTATVAYFTNSQFTVAGVIEKITDKDNFKFTMPVSGHFHLDAIPYNIGSGNSGSDLDMQITLLSGPNTVVGTYNPSMLLNAVVDTVLNAGSYFIRVEGKGNAFAPEYASLGSYSLQANILPYAVLPVRKLELKGKQVKDQHQFNWMVDADEKIVSQTMELSADGVHFVNIGLLNPAARSFAYHATASGKLHYRLHVNFDNGSDYYSNIVVLSTFEEERPAMETNMVDGSMRISAASEYQYLITDLSGRVYAKGKVTAGINSINTQKLASGMYVIQYSNGRTVINDRFLKQ